MGKKRLLDKDWQLLFFDLFWLRYKKPGDQWYELTDYLRDKLKEDGFEIQYNKDEMMVHEGNHGPIIFRKKDWLKN